MLLLVDCIPSFHDIGITKDNYVSNKQNLNKKKIKYQRQHHWKWDQELNLCMEFWGAQEYCKSSCFSSGCGGGFILRISMEVIADCWNQ